MTNPNKPSVVVAGGGYAGITAASALDDVADVTLVEPKDAFFFNVAALRALVAPEWLPRIFMPYDHLLKNGRVIRDRVTGMTGRTLRLASGDEVTGDYILLATGSSYPFPSKSDEVDTGFATNRYAAVHEALTQAARVLILGAGATGLELAGEIASRWPEKQVTISDVAADILPGGYRDDLRQALKDQLAELNIRLALGSPLEAPPPSAAGVLQTFTVRTTTGAEITADIWFQAYGIAPSTAYLSRVPATSLDEGGYVPVTPYMELPGHEGVYAIGDIAAGHPNGAGRAARQAERVAANIRSQITGEGEILPVLPTPPAIILPLGPEHGSGQIPDQEALLDRETVAELKGRDMLVDRYAERMGLLVPKA